MKEQKFSEMLQKTKNIIYTSKGIFKQKGSTGTPGKHIYVLFLLTKIITVHM